MKTIRKMEQLLDAHRSSAILMMLVLTLAIYVCGCAKMDREVPASEVFTDASMARSVPDWVPEETDPEIRYYFIPEIDVYYDAYVGEYVYRNGTTWVYSASLPREYAYFDIYDANIVFLSVGVASPWLRHEYYVSHYPVTYFYGPHVHRYGHGWHYYDENRSQFFISHNKHKVHNNIHVNYHDHDKPSRGGWGYHEKNNFKGSGPQGLRGRPGGWHEDHVPDHPGEWNPQDPKGKVREPQGKRDYNDHTLKPNIKSPYGNQPPSGRREMAPRRTPSSPPKLNTPPPKQPYNPKMSTPQRQPSQGGGGGSPKGGQGGKHQ